MKADVKSKVLLSRRRQHFCSDSGGCEYVTPDGGAPRGLKSLVDK